MKQFLLKKFTIAALAICTLPATLLAQNEKEEKPEKKEKAEQKEKKEKKEFQQIIITRNGDKEEKTVVEISGDKVKVNGKDVADLKDIQVHVNNMTMPKMPNINFRMPSPNSFSMNWDDDNSAMYKVDSNRAMLGVVTEADEKGAAVQSVTKGSAAEKAGLKKGDVITKIDSRKIDATDDVTDAVRAHKPGEKVSITYLRDGKEQKAATELGRWKGMSVQSYSAANNSYNKVWQDNLSNRVFERTAPSMAYAFGGNRPRLGLSVQDTDDGKGAKVLDVDDEGNAAKAGVKEGDIITQLDDKAVNSADEVSKLIRDKKDQLSFKLQVIRDGKPQTIDVKIPRKLKTVDL